MEREEKNSLSELLHRKPVDREPKNAAIPEREELEAAVKRLGKDVRVKPDRETKRNGRRPLERENESRRRQYLLVSGSDKAKGNKGKALDEFLSRKEADRGRNPENR